MTINRNNYEAYLMDYLDGKLSPLAVAEVLLFLEQNADIKEEFEFLSDSASKDSFTNEQFEHKQSLKKHNSSVLVNENNYTDFLVKRIEKQLGELESSDLDKFVGFYPPAKKDLALFEKTILQADTAILFENKEELKRSTRVIPLFYSYAAAAAVILFLIAFPFLFQSTEEVISENTVSKKELNATTTVTDKKEEKKEELTAPFNNITKSNTIAKRIKNNTVVAPKQEKELIQVVVPENIAEIKKQDVPVIQENKIEEPIIANKQEKSSPIDLPTEIKNSSKQSYPSLQELALAKIKNSSKETLIEENVPTKAEKKKFSGWDLAALTAKVLNRATGKDIKLNKEYDNKGNVVEYGLVADNFEFSRSK